MDFDDRKDQMELMKIRKQPLEIKLTYVVAIRTTALLNYSTEHCEAVVSSIISGRFPVTYLKPI